MMNWIFYLSDRLATRCMWATCQHKFLSTMFVHLNILPRNMWKDKKYWLIVDRIFNWVYKFSILFEYWSIIWRRNVEWNTDTQIGIFSPWFRKDFYNNWICFIIVEIWKVFNRVLIMADAYGMIFKTMHFVCMKMQCNCLNKSHTVSWKIIFNFDRGIW